MDQWKRSFLDKLNQAQSQWVIQFEGALDSAFMPTFDDFKEFLGDNGFKLSTPLREPGRRSFKFELAENAYLLMIFRSVGVGELELRCESFVPGGEPVLTKSAARVGDLDEKWAGERIRLALDTFVEELGGSTKSTEPAEDIVLSV